MRESIVSELSAPYILHLKNKPRKEEEGYLTQKIEQEESIYCKENRGKRVLLCLVGWSIVCLYRRNLSLSLSLSLNPCIVIREM